MVLVMDLCLHFYPSQAITVSKWLHCYLARSANLPEGLYILLVLISSFLLLGAKLAQYLLDQFSRSFHQMEGICVNFLDHVHFFRFLKGRCHGHQFCVVGNQLIFEHFGRRQNLPPLFVALAL